MTSFSKEGEVIRIKFPDPLQHSDAGSPIFDELPSNSRLIESKQNLPRSDADFLLARDGTQPADSRRIQHLQQQQPIVEQLANRESSNKFRAVSSDHFAPTYPTKETDYSEGQYMYNPRDYDTNQLPGKSHSYIGQYPGVYPKSYGYSYGPAPNEYNQTQIRDSLTVKDSVNPQFNVSPAVIHINFPMNHNISQSAAPSGGGGIGDLISGIISKTPLGKILGFISWVIGKIPLKPIESGNFSEILSIFDLPPEKLEKLFGKEELAKHTDFEPEDLVQLSDFHSFTKTLLSKILALKKILKDKELGKLQQMLESLKTKDKRSTRTLVGRQLNSAQHGEVKNSTGNVRNVIVRRFGPILYPRPKNSSRTLP